MDVVAGVGTSRGPIKKPITAIGSRRDRQEAQSDAFHTKGGPLRSKECLGRKLDLLYIHWAIHALAHCESLDRILLPDQSLLQNFGVARLLEERFLLLRKEDQPSYDARGHSLML